jgi:hypothetical protein
MGLTLVKEVLWRASSMLQDISAQFTLHTEREMVDWLNDGQMAIAKFMPSACSRVDHVRLQPGTKQSIELLAAADVKVGGGTLATQPIQGVQLLGLISNQGADGSTPGDAIPDPIDRRILDLNRPNWHTTTGTKVRQYVYDPRMPRHFWVEPGIPTGRLWVQLAFTAQPDRIPAGGAPGTEIYAYSGGSMVTISIGDENVDDLVNYICARACLKSAEGSQDDTKVAQYSSLFVGSINARVTAITGVNPNLKRLPLAPEPAGAAS